MRIRVSLSRSWTLGASSFASLTRVCNAIRSALELEFGPLQNSIIPDFHGAQSKLVLLAKPCVPNFAANLASKSQIEKNPSHGQVTQELRIADPSIRIPDRCDGRLSARRS